MSRTKLKYPNIHELKVVKVKLRSRLALMAFLALVPLLIFSSIAAKRLSDGTRENALRAMQETAHTTALIIDRELQVALSSVSVLSRSPLLMQGHWEQFYNQVKSAVPGDSGWVILYTPDGKQVFNTRLPFGAQLPFRPSPEELALIITKKKPHISGLVWASTLKQNVVFVDLPIRTTDGRNYVLSQAFYSDHFDVAFNERDIPSSWLVGIFDQNGITIGRSIKADEFVGKPARADTLKAIQSKFDTIIKHSIRGNIEVYDVITHSKLAGWAVAVGVPADEIDGQVRQAGYIAIGGLALAICAALISAGLVGRKLANSMEMAATASEMVGRSEELPTMLPSGTIEIDNLQRTIVDAAIKLKDAEIKRASIEEKNAQLLESEQAALRAAEIENKRKDEFLAMLGHELRNPLAAITSAIALLRIKAANDATILRPAEIIHRQSQHLREILDDLLDLSRVIYGKVQLEMQATDLGLLVGNSINTMVDTSKFSKHVFSFYTESLTINADATRIEQVFSNLIENSLKYTDEGGSISVSVSRDKDMALLSVMDTGVGISPNLLPFIFDVFMQGDNTLARTKGGMGIGLSLVHKLVALHGGTVNVHSEGVGKGSSFYVRLPLIETDAPKFRLPKNEIDMSLSGYKILLVEDQDDLREMQQALLKELGLEVWASSNGKDAIKIAEVREPQVALIDIGLPEMNGYQIAAALRSNSKTASVKLIALTGYGLKEDKEQAIKAGFDHHLTKPLRLGELEKCLTVLLPR
ncbi:ATP-binding protein [Herbaspirillum rhizosphaerae]|uniref:histidine kinase n=1 Tax=Herbaspirillum rhizosphaerae TaxID=346179 RepID=A0ABW8ZGA4_9BURK